MNQLPPEGEYVLKTRLEERMAHWFTPFIEAAGYEWTIEAAEERGYGEDTAVIKYKKHD